MSEVWKILVVDDDEDILAVTRLALKALSYKDHPLSLLNANSFEAARELLQAHDDIALILLDVVLDNSHSGLSLVPFLREELQNEMTRIILRTGQPDEAPEIDVIENYEIDDYRLKTELTQERLRTVVISALRSFDALRKLQHLRQHLQQEVRSRTQQVKVQNRELQQLNQLKNSLFSVLSHDLRSPLASLHSMLQLIERQMLTPEELERIVQSLNHNLGYTRQLLEQLLTWINSQMEGFQLKPQLLPLKSWLSMQIEHKKEEAEKKDIELALECPDALEIEIDPNILSMAVRNLLQNAIKFTLPHGRVCIVVRELMGEVEIVVQDNGVGMNPEQLESLKQREICSSRGTAGEKGSGLGLVMTREFIFQHEGRLTIQSVEGEGSSFFIYLPLKSTCAPAKNPSSS